MAEGTTDSPFGKNPWNYGEVSSIYKNTEQLRKRLDSTTSVRSVKSSKSQRSSKSSASTSRSTKSSISLRKLDAASEAAALEAKLHHVDLENKLKAELEKMQIKKELDVARARLEVISKMEMESAVNSEEELSLPASDNEHDFVQEYVSSLPGSTNGAEASPKAPAEQSRNTDVGDEGNNASANSIISPIAGGGAMNPQHLYGSINGAGASPAAPIEQSTRITDVGVGHVPEASILSPISHQHMVPSVALPDLAKSFAECINLSRLPAPEPAVFTGDPLQYPKWRLAFETLIEQRGTSIPPNERLYYLSKYLAGEAKRTVEGYFLLNSSDAYEKAKDLLRQRYGDPFIIANAFRAKIDEWPTLRSGDAFGLRKFADFLCQCSAAMYTNPSLRVLDDIQENQKMLTKLPVWLSSRWGRVVVSYKEENGRFPPFDTFVDFLVKEASIACEPVIQGLRKGDAASSNNKSDKQSQKRVNLSTGSSENGSKEKMCQLCKNPHQLDQCQTFLKQSLTQRKEFIKDNKLCFGCLRQGHRSKFCQRRATCKECSRRHPTSLHGDIFQKKDNQKKEDPVQSSSGSTSLSTSHLEYTKASMILPVWVSHCDKPNEEKLVYALLDTQSDTTFVLDDVCTDLGIDGHPVKLSLSTMTSKDSLVESRRVSGLQVRAYDSSLSISLPPTYTRNIMPANREHIPTPEMANKWPHLQGIASKIPPIQNCIIGLLIGYNCPRALAPREVIPPTTEDQPYGQRTDLGWGIVGVVGEVEGQDDCIGMSHRVITTLVPPGLSTSTPIGNAVQIAVKSSIKEVIDPYQVTKLLQLDFGERTGAESTMLSQDDVKFMSLMKEGILQRKDKHYEMPLPFKESKPTMPNNKPQAKQRLNQLKRRMENDDKYRKDYITFMENIIQCGYAEPVPDRELDNNDVWYIPHHGVYHPKKPTKIRVVFDCSARYRGEALNDRLLQGPDLINALTGVLCRFRKEQTAFMCDIEQMFFQFGVREDHRDYLRFLWWKDGRFHAEPTEYRMKVHLFGAVSSPSCANYGLQRVADDYEAECGVAAANFVRQDFYVDDGLASVPTPEEAISLIDATKSLCEKGGLRLHKFVSNSEQVMSAIPPDQLTRTNKDLNLLHGDSHMESVERALGVQWCIQSDTFQFRITLKDQPLTRRGILSTVSSIFDPIGFVAPVVLKGKQILQEMCRRGADWDCPLPDDLRAQWERWRSDLVALEDIKIQRCYKPKNFGKVVLRELHHFSDASTDGYGECSYLRMVDDKQHVHVSFLMGKARVTPLKAVTIPRLELTAATVSIKVSSVLNRELKFQEKPAEVYWTDSKVVLGYICNESRRFHVYVANRVQQIIDHSSPKQWRYVRTDDNPADIASRGMRASELLRSKWLTGPDFLWKMNIPASDISDSDVALSADDPEVKRAVPHALCIDEKSTHLELERLEYFSSWTRARRAVANCICLKAYLKKRVQQHTMLDDHGNRTQQPGIVKFQPVTVADLRKAEQEIIKAVQAQTYPEELKAIASVGVTMDMSDRHMARRRNVAVRKTSTLYRLDPFIDADGVLRVGGRMRRAECSTEIKHPVILPRKHHVTELLIRHCHERVAHQGRGMTTNEIRANGYWIVGCSSAVSSLISRCVKCRRLRSSVQEQKMADLPADRLEPAPPFTYCAVDYFGPFYVKQGRSEVKRYGVIFTCMTCRAIHLEVANSLSTDSFLNALRRFIAVRGPIRQLRSDCGTNFVGAKRELEDALARMDHARIGESLKKENCDYFDFVMNVPSASHMGGSWERQIRTVRSILTSLLDSHGIQLDDESLRTLMCETAAIVNCRPLTLENLNDPLSLEPLTPNHLLTMKTKLILPPPGDFQHEDLYSRKHWRRVQHLANEFWLRWRKEYLQSLQVRPKWERVRRNLHEGDVVIVKDEAIPRNQWQLARVHKVYVDKDGHVRKVQLVIGDRTLNSRGQRVHQQAYLERPIQKLVLLLENPATMCN